MGNKHTIQERLRNPVTMIPSHEAADYIDGLEAINAELLEVLGFALDALNYSLSAIPKNDPLRPKVQVTWESVRDAYAKAKGG